MLDTWFDPMALAIVLAGTLAATLLRCGVADSRIALCALRGLFDEPFDAARAKASLAVQIREIADDGFLRAEPHHFGDREFDSLSDLMISQRSIQSLHGEHSKFKDARLANAHTAMRVFDSAAELAPVLGLAGTLVALGQAQGAAAANSGIVGAISTAVVTTLYGLVAANFLFSPIGNAIARRSRQEERDRDEVLEWLAHGIKKAGKADAAPVAAKVAA
ncbi:MAG: MotA/TolQ/ExbB proton channel family protein [Erythrobacter sp.]|uniref:MotA/TolQ/ExbB proton channel family protein n=1 Tax=Erythrobacter sp. TaxID=1042 RepID=UPI001AFD4C26|nr:MotA/TolQ/ExbB proton channel family protein [Erythrobacter sp.]MBO6769479.1 MotA/TolQ/ExbB proton channel family protein [Erythrobacter sp.]